MNPSAEFIARAERLLGSQIVSWRRVNGGYSMAEHWSLDLAGGHRVFAKLATSESIATAIRNEHAKIPAVDRKFRCGVVAFEDGHRPLLLLEDLCHGYWPPPWRPGDVERVRETLEDMWKMSTGRLVADVYWSRDTSWQKIRDYPDPFLGLGLCTRDWLEACLGALIEAEELAHVEGRDFVHGDLWSSNICLLDDHVVFVDWNCAGRANRLTDLALWLPSLRLEGGPLPEEVETGLGSYAAVLAAFFAEQAPLTPPADAAGVRRFQLRQLRIALPWACRELGLPAPDVPYARIEIGQLNARLESGEITHEQWYAATEEVLIDAYLASDDPRAQSGKSGDETEWRWSRELVLDVFPSRATFLDVGCANGYLMESLHRWGAERGIEVEPYGLDISWRIAALARHRLPHWADRIFVGNAVDWNPPRRFDVVQSGLDEAGARRERDLVDRILRQFLVPGGILVFRAGRVTRDHPDQAQQLKALGLEPDGVIEAVHPHTGELRRTAYLRAPVP